jgi:ureidoglycolate hydrolase
MIEQYFNADAGYKPILIRDGWQIGHLNFMPALRPDAIDRLERHVRTDEVFILFRGSATLVAAVDGPDGLALKALPMTAGVTYNIPAARWHTIAMTPADLVIIVERNGTHADDVEYRPLDAAERSSLQSLLARPSAA